MKKMITILRLYTELKRNSMNVFIVIKSGKDAGELTLNTMK